MLRPNGIQSRVVRRVLAVGGLVAAAWLVHTATAFAAPSNDNFPGLVVSTSGTYYVQQSESTSGATLEAGELVPSATSNIGASVWFTWSAPNYPLHVTATTAAFTDLYGNQLQTASNYDTVLGVYQQTGFITINEVGSADDSVGLQSVVNFTSQPNGLYRFQVSGFAGATGNLNFLIATRPANDDFADAHPLGSGGTTDGTLWGGTVQPNEPGTFDASSVWYSVSPSVDSYLTGSLTNTGGLVTMGVQEGSSVNSLTALTSYGTSFSVKLTGGQTFYIEVFGFAHDFTLQSSLIPIPANNDFADAQVVTGTSGVVSGTTTGADVENGEPIPFVLDCCSVWYSWTAPESGRVTLSVTNNGGLNGVDVQQGNDVAHLTGIGLNGAEQFNARSGQTYYLRVIGLQHDFDLSWSEAAAPANDDLADASAVSGPVSTTNALNGTTVNASIEPGEPNAGEASTVWYAWTAPVSGDAVFQPLPDSGTLDAGVYEGSDVSSLTEVAPASSVPEFHAVQGHTYLVQVGGSDTTFELDWRVDPSPANDDFANAQALSGGIGSPGSVDGNTKFASREQGEPNAGEAATVWYSWTATYTGQATVQVIPQSGTIDVGVYEGSSVGGLSEVAAPSDVVDFHAVDGHTYRFQVGGSQAPFEFDYRQDAADLHTTVTGTSKAVVGARLTYKVTFANSGPQQAHVTASISPSVAVKLESVSAPCVAAAGGGATCPLGILNSGAQVTITYRVHAPVAGPLEISAQASSTDDVGDPNPSNDTGSLTSPITGAAGTTYTTVADSGFASAKIRLGKPGNTLFWNNLGPTANEVADASGLDLFDLTMGAPVDFGSYSYWASGTYVVVDKDSDETQAVVVALKVSPTSGGVGTSYLLNWSAYQATPGWAFELDVKRPSSKLWQDWQISTQKSGTFVPDAGSGTYAFRMRLLRTGTLQASGWATVKIVVS